MTRRSLVAAALLLGLTVPGLPGSARADAPFSELVVFGDSISDTGNAFLLTEGAAAGPPYFQGRFSNGPMWVEVLADELGLPAPDPSLIGGSNYAFGGARTGPGLSAFGTPNVGMQIDLFLADRDGLVGDELIVVAAGSNDLTGQGPYSPERAVRHLCEHIATLAASGGKTFLVPSLMPLGQLPGNRGTPREGSLDARAAVVNRLLDRELPRLEEGLGITILRFDMGGLVGDMVRSPAAYGLTNATDPACPGCGVGFPEPNAADTLVPDPDEYLWWDFVHMTRVGHAVVGEAAAELVSITAGR
jgi:phospholipase/lecithinase/hemolysin